MKKYFLRSSFLFIVAAFIANEIDARCGVCNDNGIACINETSFNMCFFGERNASMTLTCPEGTVCTGFQIRCAPKDQGQADCPASSQCGRCDGINMFTCTSRTTFAQCNGNERVPNSDGRCPDGLWCDALQSEICVSDCKAPLAPQCQNDAPASG